MHLNQQISVVAPGSSRLPRPISSRFFALASITALVAALRAGVAAGKGIGMLVGKREGPLSVAEVAGAVEGLGATEMELGGTPGDSDAS